MLVRLVPTVLVCGLVGASDAVLAEATEGEDKDWMRPAKEIARTREDQAVAHLAAGGQGHTAIRLDGSVSPELFMPWELFNELVHRGFSEAPTIREPFRARVAERLEEWPEREDLWLAVGTASAPLLESLREQHALLAIASSDPRLENDLLAADLADLQRGDCRKRRLAMDLLIGLWGEERFRYLLYSGVAPEVRMTLIPDLGMEDRLMFVEEGCQ